MMILDYPPQAEGSEAEQIRELREYLNQTIERLNLILTALEDKKDV